MSFIIGTSLDISGDNSIREGRNHLCRYSGTLVGLYSFQAQRLTLARLLPVVSAGDNAKASRFCSSVGDHSAAPSPKLLGNPLERGLTD